MKRGLTDIECRAAASPEKPVTKYADGNGLFLWVYSSGKKSWRFRYKHHGKEKSLTFGSYPDVALLSARRKTLDALEMLQRGLDPSEEKKLARINQKIEASNTFEAVAWEWFDKQVHTWVKSHALDVERRLKANILPSIGQRPISQITGPELLAMIGKIENRGAYDLAHRVNGLCGQIFRYGIATGRCAYDLSASIRDAITPHQKTHQNAVEPDDLPRLMNAIARYHQEGDMKTQLALQLLAHTFVRTSELIGATWDEVDFKKGVWEIPAERMKGRLAHVVPLTEVTISYLERLKQFAGMSKFILPGRNVMAPISNNTMLFALYRLGYKGRMTGHGFRAVASTVLNESGFKVDVIEKQLAHAEKNTSRKPYNRAQYMQERVKMMGWWSEYLIAIEQGSEPHLAPLDA